MRTGTGFARQHGLVCLQILALQENGIGGNPVSLGKDNDIAPHDVATGDSLALTVADDQGTGARKVAQRLQHTLGAGLLNHSDRDRHGGEGDQDDCLLQIAEQKVNDAAAQEQRQHRFSQYLDRYPKRRAPIRLRELVVPFSLQPCLGIGFSEAAEQSGFGGFDTRSHEWVRSMCAWRGSVSLLTRYGLVSTVAAERR